MAKQMLKRKDGSVSQRGLWDNIRAAAKKNKAAGKKGKKPTAQMLKQERKIKAKTGVKKAQDGVLTLKKFRGNPYQQIDITDTTGFASGKKYPYPANLINIPRKGRPVADTTPVYVNSKLVKKAIKKKSAHGSTIKKKK